MKQFLPAYSLEESKKYDLRKNKNSKYLLYKFNNWIESLNAEKTKIRHLSMVKDDISLIKTEEKNNKFLIEKVIGAVEKNNPYVIKNYRLCRRIYQYLFVYIADVFIQYIHPLEPDEIKQLDDDMKASKWRVKSIIDMQNSFERLHIFQFFYYLNGRLPLTNGLLPVPDGEILPSAKKNH